MPKGKPNRDQRLKRLLECGFFPNELPPPFVSVDLARVRRHLGSKWPDKDLDKFSSSPEIFPVPRHGRARRRLSLINPINHFKVSRLIANHWDEIREFLSKSHVSEFKPIFDMDGNRTFFDIDFDRIETRVTEILSQHNTCVKTDISRYYHTIYTHSIPWALYSKPHCKNKIHDGNFKKSLGSQLDRAVRQCQSDQTMGIPVGPDTSKVIGEIIGVGIEQQIAQHIPQFNDRSLRFVDDMYIGLNDDQSSSTIISAVSRSLSYFELDINIEKTGIFGVDESVEPDWISELRKFKLSPRAYSQQESLEEFFKKSVYLYDRHPREGVLRYAMKKSRSFAIHESNHEYYFNWLMRLSRHDTSCIPSMAQIVIESNHDNKKVNIEHLGKYIKNLITKNKESYHSFELSWALFLAKALSVTIPAELVNDILGMESSICSLIILDLNSRGKISGELDYSHIKALNVKESLEGPMWLLIYEATLKGWISPATPCFIKSHSLFGELLKKKVSFYDMKKNVKKTKKELQDTGKSKKYSRIIFANVHKYF